MRRRLASLLDLTTGMQQRVAARLNEVDAELARTPDLRKASEAYLRSTRE